MPEITWDALEDRTYETGVDHGVGLGFDDVFVNGHVVMVPTGPAHYGWLVFGFDTGQGK